MRANSSFNEKKTFSFDASSVLIFIFNDCHHGLGLQDGHADIWNQTHHLANINPQRNDSIKASRICTHVLTLVIDEKITVGRDASQKIMYVAAERLHYRTTNV